MTTTQDHHTIAVDGPTIDTDDQLLGEFHSYQQAQAAVEALSERGFPADRAVLVGRGLHSTERISPRRRRRRAIRRAAIPSVVAGAAVSGLLWGAQLVGPTTSLSRVLVVGALIGLITGVMLGAIGAAGTRRRRRAGIQIVDADSYQLYVAPRLASYARRVLAMPPITWTLPDASIRVP